MSKKNLLIVDDNISLCKILSSFFESSEKIQVCGVFHNGEDALSAIKNTYPDILLLDLIMPMLDGIGVLRILNETLDILKKPKTIVMSAVGHDRILKEAFALGIQYYMIKPFHLNVLNQRIDLILNNEQKNSPSLTKTPIDESSILQFVIKIGIPTNILGYRYIIDSLSLILACSTNLMVSDVYLAVAKKNSTSEQCVENAIRNAINRAHKINCSFYQFLFPKNISERRPSNSLFLTVLAEHIKIKHI